MLKRDKVMVHLVLATGNKWELYSITFGFTIKPASGLVLRGVGDLDGLQSEAAALQYD